MSSSLQASREPPRTALAQPMPPCARRFASVCLALRVRLDGVKNAGQALKIGSLLDYLGNAMNSCKNHHKSESARHFFQCVDPKANTDEAVWYQNLRGSMRRICTIRRASTGEKLDHSELPVYRMHIGSLCRSYAIKGTAEVSVCRAVCGTARSGRLQSSTRNSGCRDASDFVDVLRSPSPRALACVRSAFALFVGQAAYSLGSAARASVNPLDPDSVAVFVRSQCWCCSKVVCVFKGVNLPKIRVHGGSPTISPIVWSQEYG